MGSAASSISADSYDQMRQNEQQQQQHPKLSASPDPTTGMMLPAARNGARRGSSASSEDSDGHARLVNSAGSTFSSVCDLSEVVRKALMLPTTSAQHVGRLKLMPASNGGAGQVVWVVPKSSLLASSSSDPRTPPTPGSSTSASAAPTLLLSPTFILPCGVASGSGHGAADDAAEATTEWQLMLEPYAAPGNMAPPSVPPHMSRSSPLSSNLSTPTYSETNNTPNAGFHSSWPAPQTPDQGSDSRSGGVEGEGVQLWRPSIRFVWSPSCSGQPGIGSAGAGATGSVTPPHAGSAHPISIGSSVCSSISDSSADEQEGLGSSSGSSKGQVPEPVTKGVGCVTKQSERKLLPSSWSIRKKNSAPASYRAAYQAQCGKDESPAAAAAADAELAPHAGSTAVTVPAAAGIGARSLHGENALGLSSVGGSQDGASGSGWQLQCSGKLSVGPQVVDAAPAALSGFDVRLEQLGGSWGAPFSLCCKQGTADVSTPTNISSSTDTNASQGHTGNLQLSVVPPSATSASLSNSIEPLPGSIPSDDLYIQVDFSHVQLRLTAPAANSSAAKATSETGEVAQMVNSSSSSSSKAHQQHPLGLSPPHTPTKSTPDLNSQGVKSVDGTSKGVSSSSCGSSAGGVAEPGMPLPARQLEAVLLSHSPRMLVIDNFFSPELCTGLMELARERLVRSRVASGSETPSRTSWGHFFVKESARHPLILESEAQIEALFNSAAVRGGYGPLEKVEAIQVVRYHPGEFYHEHYDNRADGPLTRAATILVYLCDTEEGGSTSFPRAVTGFGKNPAADAQVLPPKVTVGAGGRGIKVFPVQGRALVFWSKRPNGDEDPNSIHAAETVLEGEKWIATRWMKDNF